ncbi:MAG TPA: hypothetical protein VLT16_09905 [Candidatus Limnocylindrales bacterium]|nr:hypothetical protein [Candidatus Limnocylindrales bacterium]
MMLWLQFAACTAIIIFSGTRMSRLGDVIAAKTGLGLTWIGVVLMASVTSLPELITGVSSVTVYNLPNIAAGDVLGSCMFNLLILAAFDVKRDRDPISSLAHQGHILTAAFGILLLGCATVGMLAGPAIPSVGWVGIPSLVILPLYLVAMRVVFRHEKKRVAEYLTEVAEEARYEDVSRASAFGGFAVHAVLIAIAASYLPHVADAIAVTTGLGNTFVGSVFVALSTSLPEIVVSREALRIGAVDLAVGGILGSNLSDLAILAVDDVFYRQGPIYTHVSPSHAITATGAATMTAITTIALVYRSTRRVWVFPWESLGIFAAYGIISLLLYLMR